MWAGWEPMKVVILGAGGQLASDLVPALVEWETIPLSHAELDICDRERVRRILSEVRPDVVINTAAFVRVDDCETHIEEAFAVNAIAVGHLAAICSDLSCTLMHVSTDYVFGNDKSEPYAEEDTPNPLNVYGISKLAGEHLVRSRCEKYFIVRSSGLYGLAGSSGKSGNFVETMLRLAREEKPIRVVDDQVLTPTNTQDLAQKMVELLESNRSGLYHITNQGHCSWFEFAVHIFKQIEHKPEFEPIPSSELLQPASKTVTGDMMKTKICRRIFLFA